MSKMLTRVRGGYGIASRLGQSRLLSHETKLVGNMDNAFNRERMAVKHHAQKSADLWRRLCIYVCIPAVILASLNAKNLWDEHWEHWEHSPKPEDRPQYPYLNIRTKSYPWGDGDKTLLWALCLDGANSSWNDNVNYHKRD